MSHLTHSNTIINDSGVNGAFVDDALDSLALSAPDAVVDSGGGGDFTTLEGATTAGSVGDTIILTAGTTSETSTITFLSGMTIQGAGMERTIVNMTGNEVLLAGSSIAGSGTISITGSAVTGASANLTSFAVGDLIVYNNSAYELATITDADTATIVEDIGITSGALAFYGLDISASPKDVVIRDLTFDVTTTVFGWLIRNSGSLRARFERVKFRGNFNVTQGLIRSIGEFFSVYEDCIFETSDKSGVRHENRNLANHYINCRHISNGTGATDWDHEILRSPGYVFDGCEFAGGGDAAIKTFIGPITGLKIVNCKFHNKDVHAIHFDTTSGGTVIDAVISNNTFTDCDGNGIYINTGGGINITGNIIQGQTLDGIQIDNDAANIDIVVTGNTIRDNGAFGVDNDFTGAGSLLIVGNNLTGNGSGATADAGSANTIANNL